MLLSILFGVLSLMLYIVSKPKLADWGGGKIPKSELAERTKKRSSVYQKSDEIVDGIHVSSGMVYDENFALVKATCTSCHSSKLIIQNRATRNGWKEMIRWMQETQGLPDLGTAEPKVLDYLTKHYAPQKVGRRDNLNVKEIEWYVLKEE